MTIHTQSYRSLRAFWFALLVFMIITMTGCAVPTQPTAPGEAAAPAAELAAEAAMLVGPGDIVMVKGSNGSKASLVAKALAALGAATSSPCAASLIAALKETKCCLRA